MKDKHSLRAKEWASEKLISSGKQVTLEPTLSPFRKNALRA